MKSHKDMTREELLLERKIVKQNMNGIKKVKKFNKTFTKKYKEETLKRMEIAIHILDFHLGEGLKFKYGS